MNREKRKQSILAGGLISTAGIFVSKLIGLLYMVPFTAIVGSENMIFYSLPLNVYTYILNVATAGLPFAVATMVARSVTFDDYKTSLLIKKLAHIVMFAFGVLSMLLLVLCSGLISSFQVAQEYADQLRNSYLILAAALIFVPMLSAGRGFYQGLKDMELNALSQTLEQIVRVAFVLCAGALCVYVFHQDQIWAAYFGVMSTGIAAIAALLHLRFYDRKQMPRLRKLAKEQETKGNDDKQALLKEMLWIAFPYLLMAALGYSDMIVNSLFLNQGLLAYGYSEAASSLISGAITGQIQKLMSIPMVLAPGFSAAIVPYLTVNIAKKDWKQVRRNIDDCLGSVLYIGIPISFCLFAFATPIYYVMYGGGEMLPIYGDILRWYALEAFLNTIGPIFNAFMMAGGLAKLNLRNLGIFALLKIILTYPMIMLFGYSGSVLSTVIAYAINILLDVYAFKKYFHFSFRYVNRRMILMLICTGALYAVSLVCPFIGLKGYDCGRFMALIQLGIAGLLSVGAYAALSCYFRLPQTIFHIDFKKILKRG